MTYVEPAPAPPVTLAPRLVRISDETRTATIRYYHQAAAQVVESSDFALALAAIEALAVAPDSNQTISGAFVASRAFADAPPIEYRTKYRKGSVTASTALTDIEGLPGATITLFTATLERFDDDGREATACVINTLVHEWTHTVRDGDGFAFVDTGRGWSPRPLVSYTVGSVAQCVYLATRYREDLGGAEAFDLPACIEAAGTVTFTAACDAGWGEQFVRTGSAALW